MLELAAKQNIKSWIEKRPLECVFCRSQPPSSD